MRPSVPFTWTTPSAPRVQRVVVIGAGLAGLAAARTLAARGVEVVVLEARDRVGGRCWTLDGIDMGAHWIHGTEGNPVTNLARELAIPTLFVGGDSSYSGGWDHLALFGPRGRLSGEEKLRSILVADEIRDEMDAERRRRLAAGAPDISVREAVDAILARRAAAGAAPLGEDERRAVEWHVALSARDDCAADEPALSLLWWDDGYEVYGYGDSVFVGGYAALVDALAAGLDVRLDHPVRRVEYGGGANGDGAVRVVTDRETFGADAAVVTLPLGVLKRGTVEFDPPLPAEKRDAIARLGMGDLAKVVLRFAQPWWPRDQYVFGYGMKPVAGHPTTVVNLWKTHRVPALVLLAGGSLARDLERRAAPEAAAWAMGVLRDMFGSRVPEPVSVARTQWDLDPWSRGAYSFVAVGSTPDDIAALAEPVDGRLSFAGEATYRHHWAGAHGALASGLREAARLLDDPSVLPPRAFTENRRWRDTMLRATRLFNVLTSAVSGAEVDARVAVLASSDVFAAVPPNELRLLATMFEPVSFAAGDAVVRAGDPATCVYAVVDGEVEVRLGDETVAAVLGRGSVVGEYGLFESGRRTATVVARTPVEALSLDYQRFQRFLLAFPESLYALLRLTVHQLVRQSNVAHERG